MVIIYKNSGDSGVPAVNGCDHGEHHEQSVDKR